MPEINPMEVDLNFVDAGGNGTKIPADGSRIKKLINNNEASEALYDDEKYLISKYQVDADETYPSRVYFGDELGPVVNYDNVTEIHIPLTSNQNKDYISLSAMDKLHYGDTLVVQDLASKNIATYKVLGCAPNNDKFQCNVEIKQTLAGNISSNVRMYLIPTNSNNDYTVSNWDQLVNIALNHNLVQGERVFVSRPINVNIPESGDLEMFINSASIEVYGHPITFTKLIGRTGNVVFSSNTTGSISSREPIKFNNELIFKNLNNSSELDLIMNENDSFGGTLEYCFKKLTDTENETVRVRVDNNPNLILRYESTNITDLTDTGFLSPIQDFWDNTVSNQLSFKPTLSPLTGSESLSQVITAFNTLLTQLKG